MTRAGDPRFYALLDEISALHAHKAADYAPSSDPLANFKGSLDFGLRPYLGILTRLRDKWGRVCTFARSGALRNERARDSHIDSAVYHLLAVLLLEDEALATMAMDTAPAPESRQSNGCDNCSVARASGHLYCTTCWAASVLNPKNRTTDKRYVGEDGDADHEWIHGHGI